MKKILVHLSENRRWVFGFGVVGIVALFLLAVSLPGVEFRPAVHYVTPGGGGGTPMAFAERLRQVSLLQMFMLGLLFVLMLVIALLMMSPEGRKRLLRTLLRLVLTIWVIAWVMERYRPFDPAAQETGGPAAGLASGEMNGGVEAVFAPPVIPAWAVFLTGMAVFLLLLGLGYWLWRVARPKPAGLPEELARIARVALQGIRSGGSFDDTVIECYVQMSAAVNARHGLGRSQAMTPAEFASRLEQAGLPAEPVRRLTRLFEKVRYGGSRSSQAEADEAVASLTAILRACEERG